MNTFDQVQGPGQGLATVKRAKEKEVIKLLGKEEEAISQYSSVAGTMVQLSNRMEYLSNTDAHNSLCRKADGKYKKK